MRNVSHESWIGIIRTEVEAYRADMKWSRETVVAQFVEDFKANEEPNAWGVEFSCHPDLSQAQKNDADKFYRWLDDVTKDNNLLSMNMARIVLRVLPMQYSLRASAKIMGQIGIAVGVPDLSETSDPDHNDIAEMAQTSGNSVFIYSRAVQDPTPENLEAAQLQLVQEERLRSRLKKKLAGAISRKWAGARAVLGRFTHKHTEAA